MRMCACMHVFQSVYKTYLGCVNICSYTRGKRVHTHTHVGGGTHIHEYANAYIMGKYGCKWVNRLCMRENTHYICTHKHTHFSFMLNKQHSSDLDGSKTTRVYTRIIYTGHNHVCMRIYVVYEISSNIYERIYLENTSTGSSISTSTATSGILPPLMIEIDR